MKIRRGFKRGVTLSAAILNTLKVRTIPHLGHQQTGEWDLLRVHTPPFMSQGAFSGFHLEYTLVQAHMRSGSVVRRDPSDV
jgi:hypothetical protein